MNTVPGKVLAVVAVKLKTRLQKFMSKIRPEKATKAKQKRVVPCSFASTNLVNIDLTPDIANGGEQR